MLSFMREQGFEKLNQSGAETVKSADPPGTVPATLGEQYLTVTARKKQVRKFTYLLAVLFCVGLLCLWIMIKKSTPRSASASTTEDAKIEMLMTKLSGAYSEIFSSLDELSDKFYKFSEVRQVENYELIKNPFRTEKYWGNFWQTAGPKASDSGGGTETAKPSQPAKLSGGMQLLSIMSADAGNCCMIDDRILYVGDSIKGFKVLQIGDNFVKLESEEAGTAPNAGKDNSKTELILNLSE